MTIFRSFLVLLLLGGLAATLAFATENQLALLPLYENAASALCADDLTAAKAAAWILATEAVRLHHDGIAGSAAAVAKADGIAGARTLFKALSNETIALAQQQGLFHPDLPDGAGGLGAKHARGGKSLSWQGHAYLRRGEGGNKG